MPKIDKNTSRRNGEKYFCLFQADVVPHLIRIVVDWKETFVINEAMQFKNKCTVKNRFFLRENYY